MTGGGTTIQITQICEATRLGDTRSRLWAAGTTLTVDHNTAQLLTSQGVAHVAATPIVAPVPPADTVDRPTFQQLRKTAKDLGITVPRGTTYDGLAELIANHGPDPEDPGA